jgi:hypothetical protein
MVDRMLEKPGVNKNSKKCGIQGCHKKQEDNRGMT